MVGQEPCPERVHTDRPGAEHGAREPALDLRPAQHEERRRHAGRVDEHPQSLVDGTARRAGPERRQERVDAERERPDRPDDVERTQPRHDEKSRDEEHP